MKSRWSTTTPYILILFQKKIFKTTTKKKMEEMDARMKEPVDTMSTCTICSRELRQEREQSARDRSRGRSRDQGGGGAAQTWKLEKEFKPHNKMSLEMTQLELQIWE